MCVFMCWDSCKCAALTTTNSCIVMDGSSESGWQRSDSSRGLNSASFLGRNRRVVRERNNDDASNDDSQSVSVRKDRERSLWPNISNYRTRVEGNEDGGNGGGGEAVFRAMERSDVSLRQWLDNPERRVEANECLHIFSQIVHLVNSAHSQGIVVHNIRPSCFVMSSFNRVSFIESASCSDTSSDSHEDGPNCQTAECKDSQRGTIDFGVERNPINDTLRVDLETSCLQSTYGQEVRHRSGASASGNEQVVDKKHTFPMKQILLMETNWYTSPEELSGGSKSFASDIYQLGVLLFELFCTFGSLEEKSTTMASLRHRVLPPQLLLKWPKEASFCLWLLHPEPSSRPKMRIGDEDSCFKI